jgi:hypothetical protein
MEIVKNLTVLNQLSKAYGLKFCKTYKYCTGGDNIRVNRYTYKDDSFVLKYFDGCFYPYIVKLKTN